MLRKQKIVVFGAAGFLGRAIVGELLKQKASVIAIDIDLEMLRSKLSEYQGFISKQILTLESLDITDEEKVVSFFEGLTRVNGFVNSSYPRNKYYGSHFFDVNMRSFNENVALNLGSTFLIMQQSAIYFKRVRMPVSLVSISSIYGVVAPDFSIYENTRMTMPVEYAAIKSAMVHLNKYVSRYIKDSDFRVNSVSPGGLLDNQPEAFLKKYKEKTNGTGMLTPNDMLGTIVFLLSDVSKYINGQNIIVDDGFSL